MKRTLSQSVNTLWCFITATLVPFKEGVYHLLFFVVDYFVYFYRSMRLIIHSFIVFLVEFHISATAKAVSSDKPNNQENDCGKHNGSSDTSNNPPNPGVVIALGWGCFHFHCEAIVIVRPVHGGHIHNKVEASCAIGHLFLT